MKEFKTFIYFLVPLLYFELVFKFIIFGFDFDLSFIYTLPFLIIISFILSIICSLFKPKVNKILYIVFLSLITFWYELELVFKEIFNSFFSLSVFSLADQATSFVGTAAIEILKNLIGIIILLVPVILLIVFRKKIVFNKNKIVLSILSLGLVIFMFILSLNMFSLEARELFYDVNNHDLNMQKLGVAISTYLDAKRITFGFDEKIVIEPIIEINEPSEIEIIYDYNNQSFDFDKLLEENKNADIESLTKYFMNDKGTLQNEYTGMFNGKNLIVFMAESFNEIGVSEELTPTLYKLINSGFSFENFYAPSNLSTIGGEFQELTGLMANNSILGRWRKGTNYFPYGLGNVFSNIGYKTYAFHNNSYKFQNRNLYLASIGLSNYLGRYNGLEKRMKFSWPASDLDMINVTVDDYIDNTEPFLVYYVTISGHYEYSFSGNNIARKNEEYVKDLPYSDDIKAYLATQIELDRALESLIKKLEEKGKLKDTVIALEADHYPYALSLSHINEVSDYKKDNVIEINRSNLIIWNSEMETVKVNKIASQIDMMPTLYNLFNIDYDSRLFIGKDILSTEPGLVIFSNRSWVSDYGKYYSASKEFVPFDGVEVSEDYVSKMNSIVSNKLNISKLIISKNYYDVASKYLVDGDKKE